MTFERWPESLLLGHLLIIILRVEICFSRHACCAFMLVLSAAEELVELLSELFGQALLRPE